MTGHPPRPWSAGGLRRLLAWPVLAAALQACGPPRAPLSTQPPRRIVSLVCAATDVFRALGALDRVVAVEDDCPGSDVGDKARILNQDHAGRLAALNVEAVLALQPDAIVAKPDLEPVLRDRGVRLLVTPEVLGWESLPDLVRQVGDLLDRRADAEALLSAMREQERALRARTERLPKVRVYYETTGPGRTVGVASIMDAMIRLAGGQSIAGAQPGATAILTAEAVLAADPEVIVLGAFADPPEVVARRPGWDRLSAVRGARVHQLRMDDRIVSLATPRCVEACARLLLPWLHPEASAAAGG